MRRVWISRNMAPVGKYSSSASARVLLFLSLLCSAGGGKLLVVPMDESHWLSLRSLLVALSQKGHQIVTVAPEVNSSVEASEYHTLKRYPVPLGREEMRARVHSLGNDLFERKPFRERITALLEKSPAHLQSLHLLLRQFAAQQGSDAVSPKQRIRCCSHRSSCTMWTNPGSASLCPVCFLSPGLSLQLGFAGCSVL